MRDSYLDEYFTFLRFPSVSTDEQYRDKVAGCAEWLVTKLKSIGLETELVRTDRHPVVWARNKHQPGRRTVMIYGHYDVQPPDPLELWESPPFEPVLKNGYVFARGATDNKGQILSHILGVQEALEEHGDLPVNLHFVIEGEEEIGSGNLPKFLSANREALKCDVVVVSDTGMVAKGIPTLSYGLRGVTALEIKVTSAKMDLHSGVFGGAVANPITALARLLATLHDANGHIAIEGFYGKVKPLEDWERKAWKALPMDGDKAILAETGAPGLFGEEGYSTLERIWGRPTAEINGIGGGYQGMGTKTVIASHAMAKLTFRLVPDQDGDEILDLAEQHLKKHLPPGVTMEITRGHSGPWYLTDPRSGFGEAAQRALRSAFGKEPAVIREGGSIPIVSQFRSILGVETLLLGLALPDCRAHSPNENFPLENLEGGIRLNKAVLAELAK
ncbi:MAG TPA: dipeptidase [Chthoniobacterales bacterium]|jgi:acetylornithine deacetylase/succinyl-diaminopimelate desuccinylase-like protein|nr:dipeptidase [Chthoniobacterales bacterium]